LVMLVITPMFRLLDVILAFVDSLDVNLKVYLFEGWRMVFLGAMSSSNEFFI